MAQYPADFRCKDELPSDDTIVQWLFAESVAREINGAVALTKREGEHAINAMQRSLYTLAADQLKKHLGVGTVPQFDAGGAQFVAKHPISIDLAIKHERIASGCVDPRLGASLGIDDREAGMAEGDIRIDMRPVTVWPAVR